MKYDQYRDTIISGLKSMIRNEGTRVFSDERRFKAMLDDYIPQIRGRQERKMLDSASECGVLGSIANGYGSDSDLYKRAKTRLADDTFLSEEAIEELLMWIYKAFGKTIPPKSSPSTSSGSPKPATPPPVTTVIVKDDEKEKEKETKTDSSSDLSMLLLQLLANSAGNVSRKIERTLFVSCKTILGTTMVYWPGNVYSFTAYGMTANYKVDACVKCDGDDYLICSLFPFSLGYVLFKIMGIFTLCVEDQKLVNDIISHAKKERWIF